jgi:hypothetical protein
MTVFDCKRVGEKVERGQVQVGVKELGDFHKIEVKRST